jgi:hypothetical protein
MSWLEGILSRPTTWGAYSSSGGSNAGPVGKINKVYNDRSSMRDDRVEGAVHMTRFPKRSNAKSDAGALRAKLRRNAC